MSGVALRVVLDRQPRGLLMPTGDKSVESRKGERARTIGWVFNEHVI